jgi:hypothetical protein
MTPVILETPSLFREQNIGDIVLQVQKTKSFGWVDPTFPPNEKSLYKNKFEPKPPKDPQGIEIPIVWKRPHEFCPGTPVFFGGKATAADVRQGTLGDCWFLCAVAVITTRGDMLQRLFVNTNFGEYGVYACRFYKNGWKTVIVDDLIPCNAFTGFPVYAKNANPNEIWLCILEKAYAKLHGSYEGIEIGFVNDGLVDISGGSPYLQFIVDPKKELKSLTIWDDITTEFRNQNCLMGALWAPNSKPGGGAEHGIVPSHAYSIIHAEETKYGDKLVLIRNPWGTHKWTGDWGRHDTIHWTTEMKDTLGFDVLDDGMFWMTIQDFITHFNQVYYCRLIPRDYKTITIKGTLEKKNAGGGAYQQRFIDNTQYQIYVKKKTHCIISLHQSDARLTGVVHPTYKYHYMTLLMPSTTGEPGKRKIDKSVIKAMKYKDGNSLFKMERDSTIEVDLEASEAPYVLIPCSEFEDEFGGYTLRIASNEDVIVKEVTPDTDWVETSFSGRWAYPLNGGSHYGKTWNENPIYKVEVTEKCRAYVTLSQHLEDTWNGIGINIYRGDISEEAIYRTCDTFIRKAYWETLVHFEPNNVYFLIPMTMEAGMNLQYKLRIFTDKKDVIKVTCTTEDIKLDDPIPDFHVEGVRPPSFLADPEKIKDLKDMGFEHQRVVEALLETNNNVADALDILLNGGNVTILDCVKKGVCTYTVTKNAYKMQRSFRCVTCDLDGEGVTLCESCINVCHKGHNIVDLKTTQSCFCDCPTSGKCISNKK